MADFNKNEYYRFSTNLNAQIAVDEEKAKKGDVDAMVRLARYFRTGKTWGKPSIAFYYEDEIVEDTLGCYYYNDEDYVIEACDETELWSEKELEENKKLAEKYAQKANETGDDRGCYEYACYLADQLSAPFVEDSTGESFLGVLIDEIEGGVYLEDATLDEMIYIEIDEDDCAKYDSNEIVCIEGKKYVRPTKEEMDGLWICRPHPEKMEQYQQIIEKLQQIEKEWLNILCDLAEKGVVNALLDLGRHYHNLSFDALFKSKGAKDGSIYYQIIHPENSDYQESFNKAVEYLERVILCDNSAVVEEASLMLGNIYAQEEYLYSDTKKAIQYYDQSGRIYGTDADLLADFYIRNIETIAFDRVLKWLTPRKRMYSCDNKALNKIIEATPKEVLEENFDKIISLNQLSLFKDEGTLDILMEKMIFSEEQLVDYCIAKIRALNKDLFIGEPVDELEKVAKENGLKIEEKALEGCLLMDLYKCKNYMICTAIYNAKKYDGYYQLVKKLADDQNAYAQYKLGVFLYRLEIGEAPYGTEDEKFFVIGKDISGLVDKTTCESMAKELLVSSYQNGNVEALLELGLRCDEYSIIAYETLKDTNRFDARLNLHMSALCLNNKQYDEAKKYLEEGFCYTSSKTLFAEELLTYYEQINNKSAQNFVWNFFDMTKEKGFCDECFSFVNDQLMPLLLDKASIYYNPQYGIRILQSSEFSTPEGYYKLGCIYSDGEHVEKNYKQALKYFKLAAKEDVGEAYYKLGYLYYYGDGGLNPEPLRAKEYFEKAIFCGINCEYAYEMVRVDLNEKDGENPMKEYAELVIAETPRGAERNARFQDDMANEFGEYWEKLNENTRGFIYSGIKTYVNNYEDDDPIFDFSAAINPMAKSLETLLGDIFYTKYKQWLRVNGVSNIKEYFESLGARVSSDKDPFELGAFRFIAYERNAVNTDYETTRKLIRANKLPAIIRKSGKTIYKLQLHEKFAEYANEIFKEDAFSSDERMQEITAFIINLVSQVEVIREDLRNRASHDTVMKAMHAEKCGNILYKTKKLLYSLISKIKE